MQQVRTRFTSNKRFHCPKGRGIVASCITIYRGHRVSLRIRGGQAEVGTVVSLSLILLIRTLGPSAGNKPSAGSEQLKRMKYHGLAAFEKQENRLRRWGNWHDAPKVILETPEHSPTDPDDNSCTRACDERPEGRDGGYDGL